MLVPESERRQAHFQLIPDTHSLKPLAIQCLRKEERSRPSALQLSERLSELKQAPQYIVSMHQVQTIGGNETGDEIATLRRQVQEVQQQNIDKEQRHQAHSTQLQRMVEAKDRQLQEKQQSIETKDRQLEENQRTIASKQQKIETKERQLQQTQQQLRDSQQLVEQF